MGKAGERSFHHLTASCSDSSEISRDLHLDDGLWAPDSSLSVDHDFRVDFDQIVENIKQLNILAGEGSSEITRTPKGAQLKVIISIQINQY